MPTDILNVNMSSDNVISKSPPPANGGSSNKSISSSSKGCTPSVMSGPTSPNPTSGFSYVYINEILAYAVHYIKSCTIDNLKKSIMEDSSADEILEAKKMLWNIAKADLNSFIDRRSTDKRSCSEANMDDLLDAIMKLDSLSKVPTFCAVNMDKIPKRHPEQLNVFFNFKSAE